MHVHAVVDRRAQRRRVAGAGQHVHLVAERRERPGVMPRVGADAAEAGLGRVFERQQRDGRAAAAGRMRWTGGGETRITHQRRARWARRRGTRAR